MSATHQKSLSKVESSPDPAPRRRSESFLSGFVVGLSAPSFFVSGELEILRRQRISTLGEIWQNVGQTIRSSAERYKGGCGSSSNE
jgi:hypothetical protein